MTRVPTHAAALFFLLLVAACGGGATSGPVDFSVSAAQNYERGMRKLEEQEWVDAAKYFAFLKARFPYSKFAVLADLRLADAQLGAGGHLEAVDAYKLFIKFHPTHEMVQNGYASFRIGEAHHKMLPGDWWLLPPSHEKDQGASLEAVRAIGDFLRQYPRSPYAERAKAMYVSVAKRLAAHEWYAANFYWKRDKPLGTVLRLRVLLKDYPDTGYDPEAMYLLGRAYTRIKRKEDAKKMYQDLVAKFPKHRRADDARSALTQL